MQPYKIHYLGPEESFSHQAARQTIEPVIAYLHKTEKIEIVPDKIALHPQRDRGGLEGVLKLESNNNFVVVPICNTRIGDTYGFLPFYSYKCIGTTAVNVKFVLCNLSGERDQIKSIVTKNEAYKQVKEELVMRGLDHLSKPNEEATTAGAVLAKSDPSVAAICSPEAVIKYGLQQIGPLLGDFVTTFGIFLNETTPFSITGKAQTQFQALLRNASLFSGRVEHGGKIEFVEAINHKDGLHAKWGIDPITTSLHFGHLACLYKLQDFINNGHKVTIVFGTFTGQVGDPSGNLTARDRLDGVELEKNSTLMKAQIECVLGSGKVKFESNAKLIKSFNLDLLLRWGYEVDHRLLMDRQDFKDRIKTDRSLSLSEILYGLFQAYDTMVIENNVEVGGADQIHNAFLMRDIMKLQSRSVPFALLLPLLPGVDGQPKMSSFAKNEILITAKRGEIREKLLKIKSPEAIITYMRMLTHLLEQDISNFSTALVQKTISVDELSNRMTSAVLDRLNERLDGVN